MRGVLFVKAINSQGIITVWQRDWLCATFSTNEKQNQNRKITVSHLLRRRKKKEGENVCR